MATRMSPEEKLRRDVGAAASKSWALDKALEIRSDEGATAEALVHLVDLLRVPRTRTVAKKKKDRPTETSK